MAERRRLIHVYTGNGKGKTTAALGLAVRALGHGLRVYICQFLKPGATKSGELCLTEKFPDRLRWQRLRADWPLRKGGPDEKTRSTMRQAIQKIWPTIVKAVTQHEYDLVILDELNCCLRENLIDWPTVRELLAKKHPEVELILTGRGASNELIETADLVSEIIDTKHPYNHGVPPRKGIEY
jgi:cob(I)alamin adenosyltransferase